MDIPVHRYRTEWGSCACLLVVLLRVPNELLYGGKSGSASLAALGKLTDPALVCRALMRKESRQFRRGSRVISNDWRWEAEGMEQGRAEGHGRWDGARGEQLRGHMTPDVRGEGRRREGRGMGRDGTGREEKGREGDGRKGTGGKGGEGGRERDLTRIVLPTGCGAWTGRGFGAGLRGWATGRAAEAAADGFWRCCCWVWKPKVQEERDAALTAALRSSQPWSAGNLCFRQTVALQSLHLYVLTVVSFSLHPDTGHRGFLWTCSRAKAHPFQPPFPSTRDVGRIKSSSRAVAGFRANGTPSSPSPSNHLGVV